MMYARLKAWAWQLALCVDRFFGCWLRGWYFVWIGGDCPSSTDTISAYVGRAANKGQRWARVAQYLIDAVMGAGHCQRSLET